MDRYPDRYAVGRYERYGRLFSVAAETAVAGSVDQVFGALWNPHGTRSLWVHFLQIDRLSQGTVDTDFGIARTTTRGTAGVTVTPDLDNDWEREITPQTGAVFDHNFGASSGVVALPRLSGGFIQVSATPGWSDQWFFPNGLRVGPGTGLAMYRLNGGGNGQVIMNFHFEE